MSDLIKGPWKRDGEIYVANMNYAVIRDATGFNCALVGSWLVDSHEAKSRLVEAAPELLEALRDLYGHAEYRVSDDLVTRESKTAFEKARLLLEKMGRVES